MTIKSQLTITKVINSGKFKKENDKHLKNSECKNPKSKR